MDLGIVPSSVRSMILLWVSKSKF